MRPPGCSAYRRRRDDGRLWSVPTKWEARYLRFLAGPRPNSINRIPSPETLARMRQALAMYRVVGVANNVEFLSRAFERLTEVVESSRVLLDAARARVADCTLGATGDRQDTARVDTPVTCTVDGTPVAFARAEMSGGLDTLYLTMHGESVCVDFAGHTR